MTDSYNYRTYYTGTPRDLENSTSLILLDSRNLGGISIDSLEGLGDKLIGLDGKYLEARREGETNLFVAELEGKIFSFNTIIYNNPVSGYIGYTVFSSLQNCYSHSGIPFKTLKISLTFTRVDGNKGDVYIGVKTYLDSNTENTEIFGKDERWQYQESIDIPLGEPEDYLKFTNRTSDYLQNKNLCILTESEMISHSSGISGFTLLSGVDVDSPSYTLIRPVMYRGDLAVLKYSVQTGEYGVSSLSRLNSFGRPYDYISGIISGISGSLIDYNGQVLLFSDSGESEYTLFFMETGEIRKYPKKTTGIRNCIVLDPWNPDDEVRYIQEEDLKEEISQSCPVPDWFIRDVSYSYSGKIGDWWEFKTSRGYYYTSIYGLIDSEVKLHFLNSRMAVYIRKEEYHFLPLDYGHTYETQKNGRILDKTIRTYSDIVIPSATPLSSLSREIRMFLGGLRRKPLRLPGCLPASVLGMGRGIIFYMSGDGLLYCY